MKRKKRDMDTNDSTRSNNNHSSQQHDRMSSNNTKISTELIDRTKSNESSNHFMTDTLAKHLFFDRIFPLLPIKSNIATYQDVEINEFFLSCRAVILNVAIARDINSVIKNNLDLIDLIIHNGNLVNDKNSAMINQDSLNSLLILVRLLSDTLEYYWEACGKERNTAESHAFSENTFEKQRAYFKSFVVGFSTHRASLHLKRPSKLKPEVAERLIQVCIRLKCNTGTLKLLRNMSPNLHASRSVTFVHILPEYQKFIAEQDSPIILEKTDLTIEYLLRFIAASNREQFDSIIRTKILEPLAIRHTVSELAIVEYIELFGCLFITNRNLPHYLKMVRRITFAMKRTVFYSLLLYYFSKSFIFWIMARPKEYISLYEKLENLESTETSDPIREIPSLVNTLFEDVYSTFNVSNILSSQNHHQDKKDSNFIHDVNNITTSVPTATSTATATATATATTTTNNPSSVIPHTPTSFNGQLQQQFLHSHHHTFSGSSSSGLQIARDHSTNASSCSTPTSDIRHFQR
ncbi:hypothetical protein C6P45_002867 [Maudiozyma exigua]|uniref:Uncharacterized protein n=1 Tax=Maudiozyma exigua TaxID=34358 RepID=A0A9P6WF27_MAUEX|nr:hypothetical protein C6P45_002867 [Kazachstania exigua]